MLSIPPEFPTVEECRQLLRLPDSPGGDTYKFMEWLSLPIRRKQKAKAVTP